MDLTDSLGDAFTTESIAIITDLQGRGQPTVTQISQGTIPAIDVSSFENTHGGGTTAVSLLLLG
jgi:hypothetical protein